jgi:hypothetical protein
MALASLFEQKKAISSKSWGWQIPKRLWISSIERNFEDETITRGFGTTRYTYFDTEAAIGSINGDRYLDSGGRDFTAKIKRGDF